MCATRQKHPHGDEGDACQCLTKSEQGHQDRLSLLADCEAVVSLGMGPRAAETLRAAGLKPVVLSRPMEPEEAALSLVAGKLGPYTQSQGQRCCAPREP